MKYLLDCGSRLVPGRYETERTYYAALTPSIRDLLKEHKANPNQIHHLSVNLMAMRSSARYADLELEVIEAEKVHTFLVHRFLLSERSLFFKELFESKGGNVQKLSFETGTEQLFGNARVAKIALDFLYSASLDVDEDDAAELIRTLCTLGYSALKAPIEKQLNDKDRELRDLVVKLDSQRSILSTDLARAYRQISHSDDGNMNISDIGPHHDVVLRLKDENMAFACHRAVLTQHSAYFHALMTSPFAEGQRIQANHEAVAELEISSFKMKHLFEHILTFLYTNNISESLSDEDTIDLLSLADVLLIMELKRLLAAKLRKFVKLSSVFDFLQISLDRNITNLKVYCLDFIDHNINDLRNSDELQNWLANGPTDIVTELNVYLEKDDEDAV